MKLKDKITLKLKYGHEALKFKLNSESKDWLSNRIFGRKIKLFN